MLKFHHSDKTNEAIIQDHTWKPYFSQIKKKNVVSFCTINVNANRVNS